MLQPRWIMMRDSERVSIARRASRDSIAARVRTQDREGLEIATNRVVTIRAHCTSDVEIRNQSQSRLLRLPPEIQAIICKYVLAETADRKPYPVRAPYVRPGYAAPPRLDLSLLLTCRKIWLDNCMLPLYLTTHTFWFGTSPRFGSYNGKKDCLVHESEKMQAFFRNLTPLNRNDVNHVRLFADMRFLRSLGTKEQLDSLLGSDHVYAKTLTITIRDIDWGAYRQTYPNHDTKWLVTLFRAQQLAHVGAFQLEMEGNTKTNYKSTRDVARSLAAVMGQRFRPTTDLTTDLPVTSWTRNSKTSGLPRKDFCIFTATWENKNLRPREKMEQSLIPVLPPKHVLFHKRPRRGGRRSQTPAKDRAHRYTKNFTSEKQKRQWEAENAAHATMRRWEEQGSLLTLVPGFTPMGMLEKRATEAKEAKKRKATEIKQSETSDA